MRRDFSVTFIANADQSAARAQASCSNEIPLASGRSVVFLAISIAGSGRQFAEAQCQTLMISVFRRPDRCLARMSASQPAKHTTSKQASCLLLPPT